MPMLDSIVASVSAPPQAEGEQATQSQSPVADVGRDSIAADALVASPSPSVSGSMRTDSATAMPVARPPPASAKSNGSTSDGSPSGGSPVLQVAVDTVLPTSAAGYVAFNTVSAAAQETSHPSVVPACEHSSSAQNTSTVSAVVAEATAAADLDQAASVSSTAVAMGHAAVAESSQQIDSDSHPSIGLAATAASTAATAGAADQCLSSAVLPAATQDACSSHSIHISGQDEHHPSDRASSSAETSTTSGKSQSRVTGPEVTPDTAALTVFTQAVNNSQDSSHHTDECWCKQPKLKWEVHCW